MQDRLGLAVHLQDPRNPGLLGCSVHLVSPLSIPKRPLFKQHTHMFGPFRKMPPSSQVPIALKPRSASHPLSILWLLATTICIITTITTMPVETGDAPSARAILMKAPGSSPPPCQGLTDTTRTREMKGTSGMLSGPLLQDFYLEVKVSG